MYADYNDQESQTLDHILGSLLYQFLTTAQQPIPDEVGKQLRAIRHKGKNVGTEVILALLKMRLNQFERAFICIDAADELEPSVLQQLLRKLKDLVTNDTRLFLTGRDYIGSEIQKHLQLVPKHNVTIVAQQEDIQEFLKQRMMDDRYLDQMNEELSKDIIDTIVRKSQGM